MGLEWIGEYACKCTERVERREYLRLRCPLHKARLSCVKPVVPENSLLRMGFKAADWTATPPKEVSRGDCDEAKKA